MSAEASKFEMFVGVTAGPDGTQTEYTSGTTGAEFGLVGEKIRVDG